jgi:hypothetical protein
VEKERTATLEMAQEKDEAPKESPADAQEMSQLII